MRWRFKAEAVSFFTSMDTKLLNVWHHYDLLWFFRRSPSIYAINLPASKGFELVLSNPEFFPSSPGKERESKRQTSPSYSLSPQGGIAKNRGNEVELQLNTTIFYMHSRINITAFFNLPHMFRRYNRHLYSLGPGSAVGEKGKKRGQTGKISASEILGRGKGRRLPRIPFGSLRSPIFFCQRRFFLLVPQCGYWSQDIIFSVSTGGPSVIWEFVWEIKSLYGKWNLDEKKWTKSDKSYE